MTSHCGQHTGAERGFAGHTPTTLDTVLELPELP